jgi:salicylate hydroxylase
MKAGTALIAGAGIGGLTTALALAKRRWAVHVLEAAPALGEIGAGVTLSPNAMKAFADVGLSEAITEAGVEPERQRLQHYKTGQTLVVFERGATMSAKYGAPYVYIHRADLHAILARAARDAGIEVRLNAAAAGLSVECSAPAIRLADGTTLSADLIIGADGVKSAIRTAFDPSEPHFTGHVVWRALLDVNSPVLREMAAFPGLHAGPKRMVVRYPVRGGSVLNLVLFSRQDGWAQEGWTIKADRRELEETFSGWAPEVAAMIDAVPMERLYKWAVFARRPLPNWVRHDCVTLVGDAAHAMTPFMGQGASSAVEDGVVLARTLEAASSIGEGLARYQAARQARTDLMQVESNLNADRLQGDEDALFGMGNIRNEESLGLFEYDARTVAI